MGSTKKGASQDFFGCPCLLNCDDLNTHRRCSLAFTATNVLYEINLVDCAAFFAGQSSNELTHRFAILRLIDSPLARSMAIPQKNDGEERQHHSHYRRPMLNGYTVNIKIGDQPIHKRLHADARNLSRYYFYLCWCETGVKSGTSDINCASIKSKADRTRMSALGHKRMCAAQKSSCRPRPRPPTEQSRLKTSASARPVLASAPHRTCGAAKNRSAPAARPE